MVWWNPTRFEEYTAIQPEQWRTFSTWARQTGRLLGVEKSGWETWELLLADDAAIDDFVRRVIAAYKMPALPA